MRMCPHTFKTHHDCGLKKKKTLAGFNWSWNSSKSIFCMFSPLVLSRRAPISQPPLFSSENTREVQERTRNKEAWKVLSDFIVLLHRHDCLPLQNSEVLLSSVAPAATDKVKGGHESVQSKRRLITAAPPEAGCAATHCGLSEDFHLNPITHILSQVTGRYVPVRPQWDWKKASGFQERFFIVSKCRRANSWWFRTRGKELDCRLFRLPGSKLMR